MASKRRILILQLKRIGDLVLTSPVVSALKQEWPDSEIVLVTKGSSAELTACIPGIDETINWSTGKWKSMKRCLTGSFDICLDFTGSDRSFLLTALSHAPVRATYQKFASRSFLRRFIYTSKSAASIRDLHTIDFHLALLECCGVDAGDRKLALTPPPVPFELPPAVGDGEYAVIHPGTARPEKMWSLEGWARVIDHLHGKGKKIVLTGSEDLLETKHIEKILRTCLSDGHINLAGTLTLPDLISVIARSALAVGVDTAAMHIAAAFEKPQVVLFGPTNPYHWRPLHPRAAVIKAGHSSPMKSFSPTEEGTQMGSLDAKTVIRGIEQIS